MSDIKYMLKPEWVSWDDVQNCQRASHEENNKKGFHMTCQDLTGEELRLSIGDGMCFVALDGEKVIGTTSVKFLHQNRWWNKGLRVAYYCYAGVLPGYKDENVFLNLVELRDEYLKTEKFDMIQTNTAEDNMLVQKLNLRRGFKYVQFSASGKGPQFDYYSVIMAKWIHGCPYSDFYCNFMFKLSKVIIKTLWKPCYRLRIPFVR